MLRRLIARTVCLITSANQRRIFIWHRLVSVLIATRFPQVCGRVFFGRDCIITGHRYIHFGGNFAALARNRIEAIAKHQGVTYSPLIIFGRNVSMEYDCHIGAVNRIEIGDNVLMASRVYISDHSHGNTTSEALSIPPNQRIVVSKGPVIIEDNVWLGEGVAVMPNVRIGRSSIIGANSVVTHDIPPYSIAAGAPARVIQTRQP